MASGPGPSSDRPRLSTAARVDVSSLLLPALFVVAWGSALLGWTPVGATVGDSTATTYVRWLLWYAGFAFLFGAVSHSVLAKRTAASIGWTTNGFQYEVAAASLGIGGACLWSVTKGTDAMIVAAIPPIAFLFFAAVNHTIEIVRDGNHAPNNTLILVWDFGISISLAVLIFLV